MSEACISVFGKAYSVLWLKQVFSFVHNDLHHHVASGNACMLPCRRRCYEKSTGWRSSNNHYLFCVCRPQEQVVKPHFHGHVRFCKKRLLYIWPAVRFELLTINGYTVFSSKCLPTERWELKIISKIKSLLNMRYVFDLQVFTTWGYLNYGKKLLEGSRVFLAALRYPVFWIIMTCG